jgi:hypothetical protein
VARVFECEKCGRGDVPCTYAPLRATRATGAPVVLERQLSKPFDGEAFRLKISVIERPRKHLGGTILLDVCSALVPPGALERRVTMRRKPPPPTYCRLRGRLEGLRRRMRGDARRERRTPVVAPRPRTSSGALSIPRR